MRSYLRLAAALALALPACTRQVPLAYVPTEAPPIDGVPAIGAVTTSDTRGEPDPTWIGAVRGGFGNSLKALHTPRPLADMVTEAVRSALAARGLLAPPGSGSADLAVTVTEFNSTQYVRREANVDLDHDRFKLNRSGVV